MIKIDVRGVTEIQNFLTDFGIHAMIVVEDEIHKIAISTRNDILKSMRDTPKDPSKASKIGGKLHFASQEGFPPAIRSGNLLNRIFVQTGRGYSRVFTDNVKYARYLEEGTRKMKARPFFEPAVERSQWERRILNRILAERFAGFKIQ